MLHVNLRHGLVQKQPFISHISIPRLIFAVLTGVLAFVLWACDSSSFRGSSPENPNPQVRKNSEQNQSPPESNAQPQPPPTSGPQEAPPLDPKRSVALQVTGIQPEGWWNNCLKVELNGKSFAIACTKDANVTGRVVRIPIPDGVSCPSLKLFVETFKNLGSTCSDGARSKQPCSGPYETSPSFVRAFENSEDRLHFVVTEAKQAGGGKMIRVHYEDQPKDNIEAAKADSSQSARLGIDFNDAIFDIQTLEVPFEIQGAAGTRCAPR